MGKKNLREEGTKEGKEGGREEKKDFFCQTQSRIDYPARAAVGARFNLQAIFLESVCVCVCVLYSALQSLGVALLSLSTTYHTQSLLPIFLCN